MRNGFEGKNVDFSSMIVLARAAVESYLTFNYVFIQPKSIEDREFRFLCWHLGGYTDRQEVEITTETQHNILKEDKKAIAEISERLSHNSVFKSLKEKEKVKVLNGEWRRKFWWELAVDAGFRERYFKDQYKFLCGYSHSSRVSLTQIMTITEIEGKRKMVRPLLLFLTYVLGKYMYDYIELIPMLHQVKLEVNRYNMIVFWKEAAEEM